MIRDGGETKDNQHHRPPDLGNEIPGNPWFISTLWLAEFAIERAQNLAELHEALPYLAPWPEP
jgi:hypothetical protein